MKLKSLISFTILTFISANVFAFEGEGVTIVSESFTHSSGFKNGGIAPIPLKKNSVHLAAAAKSVAYAAAGQATTFVPIKGDHYVSIINNTNVPQRYRYSYKLTCAKEYEEFSRDIIIPAHGSFNDASRSFGGVQVNVPNKHIINVSTTITGAEQAFNADRNVLTVYD